MNNIENCIGSGVKITQVEFNIGLDGHMYTENGVAAAVDLRFTMEKSGKDWYIYSLMIDPGGAETIIP